jgi:hypothetical protein
MNSHLQICQSDIGYELARTSRQATARGGGGHGAPHDAPTATEPPPTPWTRRHRLGLLGVLATAAVIGGAIAVVGVVTVICGTAFLLLSLVGLMPKRL